LRKYLIVAVAALTAVAFATVAVAQAPEATMNVSVTPKNAGTKKKPKRSTINLSVKNSDSSQTASRIEIWLPKAIKINTKGLKKCDVGELGLRGPSACKGAEAGEGEALARAGVSRNGVYNANPGQLPFIVTPFVADPKTGTSSFDRNADIVFYLQQADKLPSEGGKPAGNINGVAVGRLSRASGKYGSKLTVDIPEEPAQQYPAGQYNGLEQLDATLFKRKGKRSLVTTTRCKSKKHPFKTAITFVPNPAPAKATKVETTANASCSK
jgi:hypothetical protein